MFPLIPYPIIDPILFEWGPVVIRWYALAYVFGLLGAWWLMLRHAKLPPYEIEARHIDDFLVWATLAVMIGGRLGHVVFYDPGYYLDHPVEILKVWRGGMSFHGGILGVTAAGLLFTRRRGIRPLDLADLMSAAAPIGLFLGRLANFVNGELWGRPTDVPWAMVFPRDILQVPRHPSQLYEAALEGLVLFVIVNWLVKNESVRRRPGVITGVFIGGYGVFRSLAEFVREPDAWFGPLTEGQALSLPMILIGIVLVLRAKPEKA